MMFDALYNSAFTPPASYWPIGYRVGDGGVMAVDLNGKLKSHGTWLNVLSV